MPSKTTLFTHCQIYNKREVFTSLFIYIHIWSFHHIRGFLCLTEKETEEVRQQSWGTSRADPLELWNLSSCSSTKLRPTGPKRTGPKLPEPQHHHRRLKVAGANGVSYKPSQTHLIEPSWATEQLPHVGPDEADETNLPLRWHESRLTAQAAVRFQTLSGLCN